jgi:probable rRNA maturation factor
MTRSIGEITPQNSKAGAVAARKSPRKNAPATLTVDVMVNSELWQAEPKAEDIVRKAVAEAAAAVSTTAGELAIVLTDDSSIRALNREWRDKDAATNVLSFPLPAGSASGTVKLLGDIVIAYETTAHEAEAEGKPLQNHLAHLAVHGFLHLVGYDHETDQEADAMESLEAVILSRLGVPNPHELRAGES